MKIKLLVDSTITVKGGTIVDVDEYQYRILKTLNRCVLADKETKKETVVEEKKETRKAKK